jgi:mono/diheme cytochrome c family protein
MFYRSLFILACLLTPALAEPVRLLVLGNSITRHGPKADIGWSGNWGMAASAEDKDFVHLVAQGLAQRTGEPPVLQVQNIAEFERNHQGYEIAGKLREALEFQADVIVLAIGENVPRLRTPEAQAQFQADVIRLLETLRAGRRPTLLVRSCFWADPAKDMALRDASRAVGAIFVDIAPLSENEENYARSERQFEHAGVARHPGDRGMVAIAEAILTALPPPVAAAWHFDGRDALGNWPNTVPGPRPPLHPHFQDTNRAARFAEDGDSMKVAHERAPSFGHGDSVTFEAWFSPAADLPVKKPVVVLAKGDPARAGQADDNLNYALTLERLSAGAMRIGLSFAAEPEKPGAVPQRHQWWSGNISTAGLDWQHVAVTYTFGDPTSVMLYVNGRMQLFSGKWEKSTLRGPVQRPGDLQIGGGEGWYRGRLDALTLHRGVLNRATFEPRYALRPPLPPVRREEVPAGVVKVELSTEDVPGRREWPDRALPVAEVLTEEAFGFFELPRVYTATGVRGDPPGNTLLRASAQISLPKGRHRLLLRARGVARLVVDGRQLLDTPLMPSSLNGHHLTSEQDRYLDLGPDFRFAPPGNREAWCEFESDGKQPHLVVMETVFGTIRPGLGETVVAWSREGESQWQLLAPGRRQVPYTDAGWAEYEAERRAHYDRINTERRLALRAQQAPYWNERREAAATWLADTPEVPVPPLPAGMPGFNEIDQFLGARLVQVAPAYRDAQAGGPDFYRDIRPLLESRCYDCHQGSKAKGALRLDRLADALHGGESDGPALVPGRPEDSALLQRILSPDEDSVMPPKGGRLSDKEVALLDAWIRQGAHWPEFRVSTLELPPLADDLTFLRRLSLDTVGVPPSEKEIRDFLAIPAGRRRDWAIEQRLADPRWADHWMGYWLDVLAENPNLLTGSLNNSGPFRWWIHEALRDDLPMDAFVTELVRMEGSANNGGPAGFALAGQNDAPLAEKAAILASAFLGVEMKCARCHDAPAHESRQEQLFQLAALLNKAPLKVPATSSVPTDKLHAGGRKALIQVTLKPDTDVAPAWPFAKLGDEMAAERLVADPKNSRDRLAALITAPQNERFAQVLANRVWQRLMGRGLVANPGDWEASEPTHPELLRWLGREFVRSGYSLKAVARLILGSHAYQRASLPQLEEVEPLFVGPAPRRLAAEQIVDSLFATTGTPFDLEELCFDLDGISSMRSLGRPQRAWMLTSTSNERDRPSLTLPRTQAVITVLEAFGWRGARQSPVSLRESDPNVLQPAVLANGTISAWATRLSEAHGLTQLALEESSLDRLIERLYLRLLTRLPDAAERAAARDLLGPGYEQRRVEPVEAPPAARVRPKYVTWSNHLDGPANALAGEIEARARRGQPPTARLDADWRERLEDLAWHLINLPEWLHLR